MAEQKHQEPKKAGCAAILIASSAASSAADIIPRDKCDKTEKGNLVGTVSDVAHMQSLFVRSGDIDVVKTFCEIPYNHKKIDVLRSIERMFADSDRESFILYYSGHGRTLRGDWCFEGAKTGHYEFVTLKEILNLYDQRPGKKANHKLVIIADCCFSGAWVEELKKAKTQGVVMQASCEAHETCSDGKYGGVFTSQYKDVALDKHIERSGLTALPAILSAFVATAAVFVKDVIVMNLYDAATKRFTPCVYKKKSSVDLCGSLRLVTHSSWWDMNADKTINSIVCFDTTKPV